MKKLLSPVLASALLLSGFHIPTAKAYDAEMCQYYMKRAAAYMKAGKYSNSTAEIKKAEQSKCPSNVRFY